jgi:CheY-like chemotaxis protein
MSLAELLRHSGHTVIEATSADNARDAMTSASEPIDVVLLDYPVARFKRFATP